MTVSERSVGDVTVLDIDGPFLEDGAGEFRDAVRPLLQNGHPNVVLNLRGVPYIDSAALGEIARAYITATRTGGTLKLLHTSPRVRQLLKITRLGTVLYPFDVETDAVRSCVASSM